MIDSQSEAFHVSGLDSPDGSFEPLSIEEVNNLISQISSGVDLHDAISATEVDPESLSDSEFQAKVARAKAITRFRVARSSFLQACSGRSVIATIHWLKSVAGWSETLPTQKAPK